MNMSLIVSEAKRIAKGNRRNYAYATHVALTHHGFRREIHDTQSVGNTRGGWQNDIGATDSQKLAEAIESALGREGGKKCATNRAHAVVMREIHAQQLQLHLL